MLQIYRSRLEGAAEGPKDYPGLDAAPLEENFPTKARMACLLDPGGHGSRRCPSTKRPQRPPMETVVHGARVEASVNLPIDLVLSLLQDSGRVKGAQYYPWAVNTPTRPTSCG